MDSVEENDSFDVDFETLIEVYDRLKHDSMSGGVPTLLSEVLTETGGSQRWRYTVTVPWAARALLPAELYFYDDVTWDSASRWREETMTADPSYARWWQGRIVCRIWADPITGRCTHWCKAVDSHSERIPNWIMQSGLGWFMKVSAGRRDALHRHFREEWQGTPPSSPTAVVRPGRPPWHRAEEEEAATARSLPSPRLAPSPATTLSTCESGEPDGLVRCLVERKDGSLGLTTKGVQLCRVAPGGPAARAGLHSGMLLKAVDGTAVRTEADVVAAFSARRRSYELTCAFPSGGQIDQDSVAEPASCFQRQGGYLSDDSEDAVDCMFLRCRVQ